MPRCLNLNHDKASISDDSFDELRLLQTTIYIDLNYSNRIPQTIAMPKLGQPERKAGRGPVKLACLAWFVLSL